MANWFQKTIDKVKDNRTLYKYQQETRGQEQHFPKLEAIIEEEHNELQQMVREINIMSNQLKGDSKSHEMLQEINMKVAGGKETMTEYLAIANEKKALGHILVADCMKASTMGQKLVAFEVRKEHNVDIMQTLVRARLTSINLREELQPLHQKLKQQLQNPNHDMSRQRESQRSVHREIPSPNQKHAPNQEHAPSREYVSDQRFDMYMQEKESNIHDRIASYDPHAPSKDYDRDLVYQPTRQI